MGDPRKHKKKYSKPRHPWEAVRLQEEARLVNDYALKNKREIWKANSFLKKYKSKVKELIASTSKHAKIEERQILDKLTKINLLVAGSKIEDVLDLSITAILERRLQSVVYKKGLARTIKQARQFITHGHIAINGQGVNIPSYIVTHGEESLIEFMEQSALKNPEHAERIIIKKDKKVDVVLTEGNDKSLSINESGPLLTHEDKLLLIQGDISEKKELKSSTKISEKKKKSKEDDIKEGKKVKIKEAV